MRFDVDGELNMFKALKKAMQYKGACHADDLFYMFTTNYHDTPAVESKEFKTIEKIIGIFTSFAINGDPNSRETSHLFIHPCDGSSPLKCINIDENNVLEILLPEQENMKVWDSIYDALDIHLF